MKLKHTVIIISGLLAVVLTVIVLKFYYQNDPLETAQMPKCTFYVLTG